MYDKSHHTIAKIYAAAQTLFVERSYDEITMSDIARAADVTKGAIYHHIDSKRALFLRMMEKYLDRLRLRLQKAVDHDGSARERLALLTQLYLEMPLAEQRVIQLVRRDNTRFKGKDRRRLVAAYQQALPTRIEAILQDGIDNSEIIDEDPRLLSWQFVAIVEAALTGYARQKFGTPRAMAAYLTDIFFDGAAVREPVLKQEKLN